jgi:heme oxygenase
MTTGPPLMTHLRDTTQAQHARVDALPFFSALAAGTLPLASYVGLLHALTTLSRTLEQELLPTASPAISAVWDAPMGKLPLLEQDFATFADQQVSSVPRAALNALVLSELMRQRVADSPAALLGYLYVLEGSTLGGAVLHQQVATQFSLPSGAGLAYLASYGSELTPHWRAFTRRMNAVLLTTAERRQVLEAAGEVFAGIEECIEALYPLPAGEPDVRRLVAVLNPEAGWHGIPEDLREIRAALRAGTRSWQQFPYFAWRYGERGRRFTRSDSAWIATISHLAQGEVSRHLLWLGGLLAARGMPRWLLEWHLRVLVEELSEAIPEQRQDYARLEHAADQLAEARRAHLPDDAVAALSRDFDVRVGPDWSTRLSGMGSILVAAVADEAAGITRAVTSLQGWLTDSERFPPHWCEAVRTTLDHARMAVQQH